jgi:hypothetical protein
MLSTLRKEDSTILTTPKKNGKVKVVRMGPKNKQHRQLIRDKVVPKRLIFPNMDAKLGRGAEPNAMNRELDTGNFEGPGWECSSITQAGAGRYYQGKKFCNI